MLKATKGLIMAILERLGKFGLVGILNTLIDYVLFIGITRVFSIPLDRVFVAKIISGSVAMMNSFYFNRHWVFGSNSKDALNQAIRFVVITIIGTLVIQTGLVQFFSSTFTWFGTFGYQVLEALGIPQLLPQVITREFVIKTAAFGLATAFSMVWNFVMYSKVVFKS